MEERDDWDSENAEVHEPEREVKSVYSLRFSPSEIAEIREAANREGVTTSEFIRSAARSRATLQSVSAEAVRAIALAVAGISERYEAAANAGGEAPSAEALASWVQEQVRKGDPAGKTARQSA